MKMRLVMLAVGAVMLMASPARADIDQRCLGECISNGNPSSTCMPACSYGGKARLPQPVSPGMMVGQDHKLLEAPVPSSQLLLSPASAGKPQLTKDYGCINQCLSDGWQYRLCERRCVKTSCGPGSTRCKDLTGTTASPVSPPGQ